MKILFLLLCCVIPTSSTLAGGTVGSDCTFNGKNLYGKIKVVENFPDIKVQIVQNFADLKVQKVSNFADSCGEWDFVENFPDLKVQFVENFADIKIQFVEHFPGVN